MTVFTKHSGNDSGSSVALIRHGTVFLAAIAIAAFALCTPLRAEPRRIVSLNPCLDAILVQVADREQIAALSHYARDPSASTIPDIAATLPFVSDDAEEIMALKPDLILTAGHSSAATRRALERVGMKGELFPVPNTVADSIGQVRRIAALTGHPERGEALVAKIDAAMEALATPKGSRVYSALVLQPNGLAAGPASLVGEVMARAGFKNAAVGYGITQWGNVGVEQLLTHPPQILLTDGGAVADRPRWADRLLSHPALKAGSPDDIKRAEFPQTLMFCGGPALIRAAEAFIRARESIRGAP